MKIHKTQIIMEETNKFTTDLILNIDDNQYNLTEWQYQHPGGYKILQKFKEKDATDAFNKFKHSQYALDLMNQFKIKKEHDNLIPINNKINQPETNILVDKLFTNEDKYNLHKILGLYCIIHFAYRYLIGLTSDIYGGFNNSWISIISILLHGVLSLSSLKFFVPQERILTKPMIWQEFRAHNIIFAWRSILCCFYLWIGNKYNLRKLSIFLCTNQVFNSFYAADLITKELRINSNETTTATMPYWPNCSIKMEKRFKEFYAYCQYLATLSCISCNNIFWPFIVMFPIQLASFLMTLVRKGLLSSANYHFIYTLSLCLPFLAGIYHTYKMQSIEFLLLLITGKILLELRKLGLNKYTIWIPILLLRNTF